MAVMDATVIDLLDEQATRVVAANPPGKVALTVLAFIFMAIGWVIGRSWWYSAKVITFAALAVRYGYRQGAHVPVERKAAAAPA